MRVVLDTNVLLVSIGRRSPFRPVFDALLREQLTLVVSTGILLEYEEILTQRNGAVVAHSVLEALSNLRNVSRHEVRYHWRLPFIDPDDQKFVDAYVAGNADYLVSNDRHFDGLGAAGFPSVRVFSAEAFLKRLA
ncbi:putative toxin-antitoxin system toxin component, PIN family [Hymenobacter ruricola]|uniref:Toxin-antitoxin system toxin component, PIN family n=1 Tax=Hymenobacter ruricola TaxID=2791023 RepID=A0ABS0HZI6_9BACT|nr:putative toxin-antitoxin system toxin component, PIN family [Hymenobacter ruricola]MBF9220104.1 putative toxin-antitoxin system toxin component, PIN family [Hymenobacter ruricola]